MGKKEKKLSPEEMEEQRLEEQRAVQEAYLALFKEARSPPRPDDAVDKYGIKTAANTFPIPQQPFYTLVRADPLEEAEAAGGANSEHRKLAAAGVKTCVTPGFRPCFAGAELGASPRALSSKDLTLSAFTDTAAGTVEPLRHYAQQLEEVCLSKLGGVLEELVANLALPFPAHEVKGYVADVAAGLWETHADHYPKLSCLEVLVLKLFSMDGPDLDRLMGFSDAPPTYCGDTSALWEDYAEHNPAIRGAVNDACRLLLAEPHGREARGAAKKWVKTLCVLLGMMERMPETTVYKGVSNIRVDVEQLRGKYVGWVAPCTASTSKPAAQTAAGTNGVLWTIKARQGVDIGALGQYPDDAMFVLPAGAVLEVTSVSGGEEGVAPAVVCATMHQTCLDLNPEFGEATVTQALADAKISSQWLSRLAALRAEDDESIEDLNLEATLGDAASDDDDDALAPNEIATVRKLATDLPAAPPAPPAVRPLLVDGGGAAVWSTPEAVAKVVELLREQYVVKGGDLGDELCDNLRGPHQRGSMDHVRSTNQRLAAFATALGDGAPAGDLLVWMYTASALDVDALLGFADVPDPPGRDARKLEQWLGYRKRHNTDAAKAEARARNGEVGGDVMTALRAETIGGLDAAEVKKLRGATASLLTLKEWPKAITCIHAVLAAHTGPAVAGPLFHAFGAAQHPDAGVMRDAAAALAAGTVLSIPYFAQASTDQAAETAAAAGGVLFELVVDGAFTPYPLAGKAPCAGAGAYLCPMMEVAVDGVEEAGGVAVVRATVARLAWGGGGDAVALDHARRDLAVFGRRLQHISDALDAGKRLSSLDKLRHELCDAAEGMRDPAPLFIAGIDHSCVVLIANGVKLALEGGRTFASAADALAGAAEHAGPARLRARVAALTAQLNAAEADDRNLAEVLAPYATDPAVKPDAVRRDAPDAEDLARWLVAAHALAAKLAKKAHS
eukprot:TRINITY_DN11159_c0_g1_i1.p1 TRINITY_DN11159_c0_g1~~TRINITY_DN11159_c0_g1_i1.p1  ORF type:complete len:958 (+),score=361.52 TRINITY_DN11159_c0_g1_i1:99-2972(+)